MVPEFGAAAGRGARRRRNGRAPARCRSAPPARAAHAAGAHLRRPRRGSRPASGQRARGFVATFDDITELQSAQRKAAWADVARRIAHEIKNPLTPIQLSAERLKRRFAREITSDPETFTQCADTIVRHVGDIGRMVDEFSAFARMPEPVIKPEDIGRVVREAMVLQRTAHPEIALAHRHSRARAGRALRPPPARPGADQSAAERRRRGGDAPARGGRAAAGSIARRRAGGTARRCRSASSDDGIGLPEQDRDRLTEPYVTHKPKGTGLGLAIVKKIMEDHGGRVTLEDRAGAARGAVATLTLPLDQRRARTPMAHDILIVDDEPDIRMLVDGILRDEGYDTRQAGDCRRRAGRLPRAPAEPGDARRLAAGQQARRHRHPADPARRGAAGAGGDDLRPRHHRDRGAAIQHGAYDFIEKPFKSDRLLLVVRRALEAAQLARENAELRLRAGAGDGADRRAAAPFRRCARRSRGWRRPARAC